MVRLGGSDWWRGARQRAKRRKSPWNLLLIPCVLAPLSLGWWALASFFLRLHLRMYPGHSLAQCGSRLSGILFLVAPFFIMLTPSMMLANRIVRAVPAVRKTLDGEAESVPDSDYRSAQRYLTIGTFIVSGLGLIAAMTGVLLPL